MTDTTVTEFITMPLQDWENTYTLMGICLGTILGIMFTVLGMFLYKERKS